MNADQIDRLEAALAALQPEPDPVFKASLREEVVSVAVRSRDRSTRFRMPSVGLRIWKPAALLALLMLLVFFVTPTGRALAQEMLRLGIYLVTDEPSDAEKWLASQDDRADTVTLRSTRVNPDEANLEQMAGFPVYYPTYLPQGYRSMNVPPIELVSNSKGEVVAAEVNFIERRSGKLLFLKQYPVREGDLERSIPLETGEATVEAVSVHGEDGLWLEEYAWGTKLDSDGEGQIVKYNLLVWTQTDGEGAEMYFWLGSEAGLSKSEMLKVAASMTLD